MSKILEAAARRPCPTCGGKGKIYCHAGRDGDCSWTHCPQLKQYLTSGCPYLGGDASGADGIVCPDCQDSESKPTGLWLPELTVECEGAWYELGLTKGTGLHDINCGHIPGTTRISWITSDNIDAAMERLGVYEGSWLRQERGNYLFAYSGLEFDISVSGATRDLARIAAAEAVIRAVWPEVENG
jgi:hypothetical protein